MNLFQTGARLIAAALGAVAIQIAGYTVVVRIGEPALGEGAVIYQNAARDQQIELIGNL